MRRYSLLLPIALAGCQTAQPRVEFREVMVPVRVACVEAGQIPVEPPMIRDQLTGNAAEDVGPLAVSAMELRKALRIARALLAGCV